MGTPLSLNPFSDIYSAAASFVSLRGQTQWYGRPYTGNTTTTKLLHDLTPPAISFGTTENITDEPTNKYGAFFAVKTGGNRGFIILITTSGELWINSIASYNSSTDTTTLKGWTQISS